MAIPTEAGALPLRPAGADIRATREARTTIFKKPRPAESVIHGFLLFCGVLSIFTSLGIVYVLGSEALLFFRTSGVDLIQFFTSPRWQPQSGEFGILALVSATVMTTVFGMIVAMPLGLGAAIYLSEYAKERTRATLKPILEILAGIPTVVYGYFALTFMTPLLRGVFGQDSVSIYNVASAGLVMGIMILPTITSMAEDALSAVPRSLREASYGLSATKFETVFKVVLPAALSGIVAAFIVGISRAVGETMIVALAAGAGPCILYGASANCFQPFGAAETMTGHIVRISGGDLSYNSVDYNSLFAIGLTLFVFTLILNMISRYITNRFREVYQ
jgi:phosphate transport system permease protein